MRILTLLIISFLLSLGIIAQESIVNDKKSNTKSKTSLFNEINKRGEKYITPLKNGQIESLKNANPPKDTWKYTTLENYKRIIEKHRIKYGSFIQLSSKVKDLYSFNFYAMDDKPEPNYYFAAVVSYKLSNGELKFHKSYLFTEKESLMNWWKNVFGYYIGKEIKEVPDEFLQPKCPPPPFKPKSK